MKYLFARPLSTVVSLTFLFSPASVARQDRLVCGTSRVRGIQERFLHRQAEKARSLASSKGMKAGQLAPRNTNRDLGNIAIIDDSGGVISHRNDFNLDHKSLSFTPTNVNASSYKYQLAVDTYDASAVSGALPLTGLGDDDSRAIPLPFPFTFYGTVYTQIFVNSDGNATFGAGDSASLDRSLGRMSSGPPRIAPLYADLNPSDALSSVSVLATASRFTINWTGVPEFSSTKTGLKETFQLRLYPDSHIEISWSGINTTGAVVGISPGRLLGNTVVLDFSTTPSAEYSGTVAETFGSTNEVDIQLVSQHFYQTHDDAYDYLVIFNNLDVQAGSGAVSYEETQRGMGTGFGQEPFDASSETGSAARLQSLLNMGPLSQFPTDPNQLFNGNSLSAIGVLAHEAGHLFLAYASVLDPNDPTAQPMLGRQLAHWNFLFNSEASLLEGNRIADNGAGTAPRFKTTDDYQQYAPLDQYLMGFRLVEEVAPTFLVNNTTQNYNERAPQSNVTISGDRRDITVSDLVAVVGRRTPDATVAQRRFRFAFILVSGAGKDPSANELAQIDNYRTQFETAYRNYAGQRAWADTTLRRVLRLSVAPAAGVLAGSSGAASINLQQPASSPLTVTLASGGGLIGVPATINIPAGASSASFLIKGLQAGVDDLTAQPSDATYETSYARVQVAAPGNVSLSVISGNEQNAVPGATLPEPVVVRVTDINNLAYSGVSIQAADSSGGSVHPATATTDANGRASFQWTPGPTSPAHLTFSVAGSTITTVASATGAPKVTAAAVVNAASFSAGITPGGIATLYGIYLAGGTTGATPFPWPTILSGVQLLLNNSAVPLLYTSDGQINFLVPTSLSGTSATLVVQTPLGTSAAVSIPVSAFSPGIFFDAGSGFGAILNAGTTQTTATVPAARGSFVEIYCTGLGPVSGNPTRQTTAVTPKVTVGGILAPVSFSGLAPGYQGLYQIDAQIPQNAPTGPQPIFVTVNDIPSNTVKILVQ